MKTLLLFLGLIVQPQAAQDSQLEKIEKEIQAVLKRVQPTVVLVESRKKVKLRGIATFQRIIRLSGVVYSKEGHVITMLGGIAGAEEIDVELPGKGKFRAKLIGGDRVSGLAVLKIEAGTLTPAELAPSEALRPGKYAITVGNAYGLKGSWSLGHLTGTGRKIRVERRDFNDMLQISAQVAPGDSGGFVADSRGRLLGIIHSVFPVEAEGATEFRWEEHIPGSAYVLTFAVRAEVVRFVADSIIRDGKVRRGYMGITVLPLDETTRTQLNIPKGQGCLVRRVRRRGYAVLLG